VAYLPRWRRYEPPSAMAETAGMAVHRLYISHRGWDPATEVGWAMIDGYAPDLPTPTAAERALVKCAFAGEAAGVTDLLAAGVPSRLFVTEVVFMLLNLAHAGCVVALVRAGVSLAITRPILTWERYEPYWHRPPGLAETRLGDILYNRLSRIDDPGVREIIAGMYRDGSYPTHLWASRVGELLVDRLELALAIIIAGFDVGRLNLYEVPPQTVYRICKAARRPNIGLYTGLSLWMHPMINQYILAHRQFLFGECERRCRAMWVVMWAHAPGFRFDFTELERLVDMPGVVTHSKVIGMYRAMQAHTALYILRGRMRRACRDPVTGADADADPDALLAACGTLGDLPLDIVDHICRMATREYPGLLRAIHAPGW
jgi:hypothetical protein